MINETDADIEGLLKPYVEEGADPSTIKKAVAFYKELSVLDPPRVAVLLAYQQVVIEGLATAAGDKFAQPKILTSRNGWRKRY